MEGGRAVYRLARDGWGKSGQRKKRAGGEGGGGSGHTNDTAMEQVAWATASTLGEIKQQAVSCVAKPLETARAEPWPSPSRDDAKRPTTSSRRQLKLTGAISTKYE